MTKVSSTKSKKPTKNKFGNNAIINTDLSVDFDIGKNIFRCKEVKVIWWRISSSGIGFHFSWTCWKRSCKHCSEIEKRYDDTKRYAHDTLRPRAHRRILWDSKGGTKAGPWQKFTRTR